ncbi:hypothetical protein GCM10009850_111330 [Nonomuraea monospora]|uniref:Integrase catalytic domain-containing protein n=1 Tax=Nonomuraea monospora TaxID=568818 RepID=A0ABN3D250_9ACTN
MLLRLAYLTVTNAFAALRLPPMGDRDKDVEIRVLRHQITVLERQLGADTRVRFAPVDRVFLLMRRRHARTCRPIRPGRPPTVGSIRTLILRLVRENPGWGYRRVHGELAMLGIKVAPSTVWEILKQAGLDPAPERVSTTWADFLRSQADALLASDSSRPSLSAGNASTSWRSHRTHHQTRPRARHHRSPECEPGHPGGQGLVMDLDLAGCRVRFLIRDRDGKFPAHMNEVLAEGGIKTVLAGIRIPRMNSIMERCVQSCRHELLDRCLTWNERHLRHALPEYEHLYNQHRAHQALNQAAPLRTVPDPITDPEQIINLNVRRRDRLGGVLHEYSHAV